MSNYSVFTSESDIKSQPDKLANQIPDEFVDAVLRDSWESRIAEATILKLSL